MHCDYFGCSLPAVASSPILDDDGEDQGTEELCAKHHPNYRDKRSAISTEASNSVDKWLASIKKTPVSGLSNITSPINFEQVSRTVMQTESLNRIQNNVRDHRS